MDTKLTQQALKSYLSKAEFAHISSVAKYFDCDKNYAKGRLDALEDEKFCEKAYMGRSIVYIKR